MQFPADLSRMGLSMAQAAELPASVHWWEWEYVHNAEDQNRDGK